MRRCPLASNETAQGRALNRRIEVEFWYDDPLQEMPDEPQLCPAEAGDEIVTKVYDPPWGRIEPLAAGERSRAHPAGYTDSLRRALDESRAGRTCGCASSATPATSAWIAAPRCVYGDDIGLSAARARRAMETVAQRWSSRPAQAEHEGRGYVQSDDVVNAGFIRGEESSGIG